MGFVYEPGAFSILHDLLVHDTFVSTLWKKKGYNFQRVVTKV